jgi:hypothetical protein
MDASNPLQDALSEIGGRLDQGSGKTRFRGKPSKGMEGEGD